MPGHFRDEMDYLRHLTWEGAREVYPGSDDGVDPRARRRLGARAGDHPAARIPRLLPHREGRRRLHQSPGHSLPVRGRSRLRGLPLPGLARFDPMFRLHPEFQRFLQEREAAGRRHQLQGRPPRRFIHIRSTTEPGQGDRRQCHHLPASQSFGRRRGLRVHPGPGGRSLQIPHTRDPALIRLDPPLPEGMTAEMIYDICWRARWLSPPPRIHSGGMVIADRPLWQCSHWSGGWMEGRTVPQWDKDDWQQWDRQVRPARAGDAQRLHLAHDLIEDTHYIDIDLATIPQEPAIPLDHEGRHRRIVPDRVPSPDRHPAQDEAQDLLRPGGRGCPDPARADPGTVGASLSAAAEWSRSRSVTHIL